MQGFKHHTTQHLDRALSEIRNAIYTVVGHLNIRAWCTTEPVPFEERTSGDEKTLAIGDTWGGLFDCAWFHFTGEIPADADGKHVVLLLDVNGEMCVFDETGLPVRGLTNVASTFDYSLGRPGKRVLQVSDSAGEGEEIRVWADAGCNDLFGNLQGNGAIREAAIAVCNDEVRALYYDFEVLLDFLKVLPEDTPRHQQILTGLHDVMKMLYSGVDSLVDDARAVLAPLLAKQGGDPSLSISAVGHAHMDLAWLWPIRETIRKGTRTFATMLELMERYPDYIFGASQPHYFLWMKLHYPRLYDQLKGKVREGRLEPQGAMWVEADTNVSGGEALVRQVLLGKRFFRQEFGVDINYLWLPDVFGYNAALPQILRGADVPYFSTQKLSWSLINNFPYQSFHWQGIDGSTVLTHMLPEETYNGPALPRSVHRIERNYKEKDVSSHALMAFGIGDGGGGPGAEHLERLDRIKNLEGLSPVTQESVADFFEKWGQESERFPTWVGELYLERHQGTMTTQAWNKRYNRKMELGLRELEWTSVLVDALTDVAYPSDKLEGIWHEVLLYQFHDILPGSSIKRVYDESVPRYRIMLAKVTEHVDQNDTELAHQIDTVGMDSPVLVQNSLSWERTEWVCAEDQWHRVTVPSMGYTVVDAAQTDEPDPSSSLSATESSLENDVLRVEFGEDGGIISVTDKRVGREAVAEGGAANRLAVYRDLGDAWDFPMDYAEQTPRYLELVSATPAIDGPRAILKQVYRLGHSELVQEVTLTQGSARIDFVSHLHWRETQSMLRTTFPVAVHADEATFDIQFGHIRRPVHRNTSWDLARDEVPAQKWVDLSQRDYGVALLNDCKYGHKVKGNVIDLNLLRSVPHPGPRLVHDSEVAPGEPHGAYTDQCDHEFTYSLLPHVGDSVEGRVNQEGYQLNVPLRCAPISPEAGDLPTHHAFLEVDAPNVIIEAVKKAEDGDDLIIRLYESAHQGTQTELRFGFPVEQVSEVNLMEEHPSELALADGTVVLSFRPFEIKTLRVTRKG